jgi:putative ABC transport system permease protein
MSVRGAAASAAWGLRAHRGTGVLLVVIAAVGLGAVLPVALLVRAGGAAGALEPRLLLASAPGVVEPGWDLVRSVASLQSEAVRVLFQALAGAAAAAFAVSGLGVLLLFAARAGERMGETALRRAVGASGRTLLLAALLEGAAVAACALALGAAAGGPAAGVAQGAWPGALGRGTLMPAGAAALAMVLAVLAGATLALIFAPRRRLTDTGPRPLGLVVPTAQLGLALVILTASALMARHAAARVHGASDRPLGGELFTSTSAAAGAEWRSARYAALLRSLEAGAEFDTVSLASAGAVVGLGTVSVATTDCGICRFGGIMVPWHSVAATHQFVSADSFHALGVRLLAGRGITAADAWDAPRVAVVSRALALLHFQNGDAIGRRMLLGDDARTWHTVVGVVDVPPAMGLGGALLPTFTVYASVLQHPARNVELLVRPRRGHLVGPEVRAAVAHVLGLPPDAVARMSETRLLGLQLAPVAWFGKLFEAEGWAMLFIAALASLVQMRLWVRAHEPELGLRRAVGARRGRIIALVLLRAAGVGAGGVAVGLWFGPAVWSALGTVVRGLPAWDAGLVLRYAALLVAVTTLGALVPAWRAVRAAPARLLASGA